MVDCCVKIGLCLFMFFLVMGLFVVCGIIIVIKIFFKCSKEYFVELKYGVKVSFCVVFYGLVLKGGGCDMVGKFYVVKG